MGAHFANKGGGSGEEKAIREAVGVSPVSPPCMMSHQHQAKKIMTCFGRSTPLSFFCSIFFL